MEGPAKRDILAPLFTGDLINIASITGPAKVF